MTYLVAVSVDNTQSAIDDGPQTIQMDFSFLADTTGQSGVAIGDIVDVKVNYGPVQNGSGPGGTDAGIVDDGGSTATLISESLTGPLFQAGSELLGTVELTDLEAEEQVVVRIDVKLFCTPGSNPTGNLQGDLQAARLTFIQGNVPVAPPEAISGGAQTIPFKQIGDIAFPELNIEKTVTTADGTCPGSDLLEVATGDAVKYCYVVSNPGQAPLYDLQVSDDNGTPGDPSDDFAITLSGLTDIDGDGSADDLAASGTATGEATVTLSTPGTVANTATASGNDSVVQPTTLSDSDTATVEAVDPNAVTLVSLTAEPREGGMLIAWETATEIDVLGFYLYRAELPDGVPTQLNGDLIPAQSDADLLGARYEFVDGSVQAGVDYDYWLEEVDGRGHVTKYGPVRAQFPPESPARYRLFLPIASR